MAKLILNDVTSGYASTTLVNANNALTEAALEKTLSRDGTSPNQMEANLDMNGNMILNQANPITVSGFNWEGPWVTGTTYQVGDVVEENGTAYIAIVLHTASALFATDSANWQTVASANLPTQAGHTGEFLTTDGTTSSWTPVVQRETVSVMDYGADPTGVSDSTTAFTDAQASGAKKVLVPAGTYLLNNLRYKTGVVFEGEGYNATILKQGSTSAPAIYALSDVSTGQLIGIGLKKLQVQGFALATVAAVKVEATTPYVVSFSDFDYHAYNVFRALELVCTVDNEVYSNKFNVFAVTCSGTAFITKGVYNEYKLEAVLCATGSAIEDTSIDSTFAYAVTDGTQEYGGQNCIIINPTVETIFGAASSDNCAFRISGYDHTVINPTVTEVPTAKANTSFKFWNQHTIINPKTWGTSYPAFPFLFDSTALTTIIAGRINCTNKIETYTGATLLSKQTIVGESSTYSIKDFRYDSVFTYTTAATYTVDANIATKGLDSAVMFGAACTVTLPSAADFTGRVIRFCTRFAGAVVSASANVTPLTGAAGTAILPATIGAWTDLQSDGASWHVLAKG